MNVGDYVRTKNYGITKILNTYNNTTTNYSSITLDIIDCFGRLGVSVGNNEIIKSSTNIIDLIEVGDYVNSYYVEDVRDVFDGEDTYTKICLASGCNYFQPDITEKEDIKSIVTKEQFESMEYKVGE